MWEARRLLSAEASKADASRHYGFYIDGDIAKLPGGKFFFKWGTQGAPKVDPLNKSILPCQFTMYDFHDFHDSTNIFGQIL